MSSPYELLAGLALLREKKRLADTSNDKNLESWSALLVRLGDEVCVLRQDDVDEIIAQGKLSKVNGVDAWVIGLGYFRGQLLTVLDGQRLFGIQAKSRAGDVMARIMVVGAEEEWFGLRVDELIGIRHVWSDSTDAVETSDTGDALWSGYVERWIKLENKVVPVLQIKQLMRDLETAGEIENK
ncbi:MAG: chemotaxis protein CheW [Thiolinea sp.]